MLKPYKKHVMKCFGSKECYQNSFKAAVALLTVLLITFSQSTNLVIPIELKAEEYKIAVQNEIKQSSLNFEQLICKIDMKTYRECLLAHMYNKKSINSLEALDVFTKFIFSLFLACCFLMIASFSYHPFYKENHKEE